MQEVTIGGYEQGGLRRQGSVADRSVSVIVPTFNRAGLVMRSIRSILAQTSRPMEIIVVDDCSTDDTAKVIAGYDGDIKLEYIRLEKNGGGAVARNAGIRLAGGDHVAFLDSDDEWLPDHLSGLMAAAGTRRGDFVVASSALRIGKKLRVLPGRPFLPSAATADKLHFVLSAALAFQTSTLLMPTSTARRFMFDGRLRRHQDWDLVFRMIESGMDMTLLPQATVRYYTPDTGNATNVGISKSLQPSMRFLAKHWPFMATRTRARFGTLQIKRRSASAGRIAANLVCTLIVGGIGPKEFLFYLREGLTTRK